MRIVLCWNDATALGATQALRARHSAGERRRLYVGGQGAPAIVARETLVELQRDDVLRCLVTPRLRDLADALVDLPRSLLRHDSAARDLTPPIAVLTPASRAARDFQRDYAPPAATLTPIAAARAGREPPAGSVTSAGMDRGGFVNVIGLARERFCDG